MSAKKEIVIAECSSGDEAKKAVQTWVRENEAIAARLGPQDLIVDLIRCDGGKNRFRCRALLSPDEPNAEPGARANGPERPWLILNVRQKKSVSASPQKIFVRALGVQVVFCAAIAVTTIWTFEVYRYAMIPYWPISYFWERFLPWGRDREQIAIALTLWIPLVGCLAYSGLAYAIALFVRKKEPNQAPEPTAPSGRGSS